MSANGANVAPGAGDELPCWRAIGVSGDGSCPELRTHVHCRNCPVFTRAGRSLLERAAPPGYRDEWTHLLAQVKPAAQSERSVLVFRLAEEWLAVETSLCAEVAEWRAPHRIAHRPAHLLAGMVNIRGELSLCVSLHGVLGLHADARGERRRLVVVSREGVTWVFTADEVRGVVRFAEAEVENTPMSVAAGLAPLTRRVFRWRVADEPERRVGLIDGDALFTALRGSVG
jgi:chemotaxis-related protein WspD